MLGEKKIVLRIGERGFRKVDITTCACVDLARAWSAMGGDEM